MLQKQATLALELIFRGQNDLSFAIRERIKKAVNTDWEETGIGFYSKIKLQPPLAEVPDIRMWEYNFSHPDFPHGSSYICTVISETELELEAVTFGGTDWPNPSDSSQFKELR